MTTQPLTSIALRHLPQKQWVIRVAHLIRSQPTYKIHSTSEVRRWVRALYGVARRDLVAAVDAEVLRQVNLAWRRHNASRCSDPLSESKALRDRQRQIALATLERTRAQTALRQLFDPARWREESQRLTTLVVDRVKDNKPPNYKFWVNTEADRIGHPTGSKRLYLMHRVVLSATWRRDVHALGGPILNGMFVLDATPGGVITLLAPGPCEQLRIVRIAHKTQ